MGMDRVAVDVVRHAAIYASEEMGVVLRNTAYSPNIKDRSDHTCAILTPEGDLVAQAEHIPVHIGSMAVGVKAAVDYLRREGEDLEPGDVVAVNDPYIAGTHLNDVMLLKPVYSRGRMVAIVANKAHHVDIGGLHPGSIGGSARELLQEGLIIPPVKISRGGRLDDGLLRLLESNVRTPRYLRGDLKAQLAALNVGERRVVELASRYGEEFLLEAWREILGHAEAYARRRIEDLGVEGVWSAEDVLELSGGEAVVKSTLSILPGGRVRVDFTGTSPQVDEPVNAVYGVTVAATTFALKTVVDPDMPVNQGFFRAVEIEAPEGSLVNPRRPAPVSGGNTETSQRIADVVFMALAKALPGRVPAASCGSMTNVMLGGPGWAFYETVACGEGARPVRDGYDGVHTNMTNTLNTPVERMETEYPVLFVRYELRADSEGPGRWRGGLGVVRAFKLTGGRATLTLYGQRCRTRPWGLEGGSPGEPAAHYLVKKDGSRVELGCTATVEIEEGDTVYIQTPGGGGYGDPCIRDRTLLERDLREEKVSPERAASKYCYNIGEARTETAQADP
ncbi:hydantoin utilization protein B [Aeropyrum pernix K1]|uniref:Hydantoin utilization protein B n=2 Tax=Aeropyrum pernix TaxID=56636 RepID=Q9YCC5_AERPE|nr:hydantoin utilization protein B [Aeropyrum pernix K1]